MEFDDDYFDAEDDVLAQADCNDDDFGQSYVSLEQADCEWTMNLLIERQKEFDQRDWTSKYDVQHLNENHQLVKALRTNINVLYSVGQEINCPQCTRYSNACSLGSWFRDENGILIWHNNIIIRHVTWVPPQFLPTQATTNVDGFFADDNENYPLLVS